MSKTDAMALAQEHQAADGKTVFGFWVYLMTDCVLFASLFATYAVLHDSTAGGESAAELFDMPFVLVETILLLVSSFTAGVALLAARDQRKQLALALFGVTFLLGVSFLVMEISEFRNLYNEGNSWQRSAFLSSFFTLVATHGLHIFTGLTWMGVMMLQIVRRGFNRNVLRRLTMLTMFWHFLDVVWIFIFTIVYSLGASM